MSLITFRTSEKTRSVLTYLALITVTMITFVSGNLLAENGAEIRLFGWDALMVVLLGFVMIGFQKEAGFPELLERSISSTHRFFIPFLTGFLYAAADMIVNSWIPKTEPLKIPAVQPFGYTLLYYASGAMYFEIVNRLLTMTLVLYLVNRCLSERYHNLAFWMLAILISLYLSLQTLSEFSLWISLYGLIAGFSMNLLQALYYKKAGFLASLSVQFGHYFLWHFLAGIYNRIF